MLLMSFTNKIKTSRQISEKNLNKRALNHVGGFQLLDLIIPEVKSHVIPYKLECSH